MCPAAQKLEHYEIAAMHDCGASRHFVFSGDA
jgi:hypothetical protein